MKLHKFLTISILIFSVKSIFAQNPNIRITLPNYPDWNLVKEGKELTFDLHIEGSLEDKLYKFSITQGKQEDMKLDSLGHFSWTPSYNLVDRLEKTRTIQLIVEATANEGDVITQKVEFKVLHTNRPPIVNQLKTFYVRYNTSNSYHIDNDLAFDPDNDPIIFIPSEEQLPEGMKISSQGEISWHPSFTQFKQLKDKSLYIDFYVEDQPAKNKTLGKLKIDATQLDLPPAITTIPKLEYIKIKENSTVNIRFYISDPNGEDDIENFDFVTTNTEILHSALIKNSASQYEFIWTPTYDFVKDPKDSLTFTLDFFVIDKTQNREVKTIKFSVLNAINEQEADKKLYALYEGTLQRGWELLEQMKEKEEELKKTYNKAKKGKRNRSVINASLGATTGLSSIFTKEKPDTQRLISTIGGTTVLTIGTLEATEVIGRSMKDLMDRLNYIIEKKNEIQTKGDIFARDFSLKSARRSPEFVRKVDDFMAAMSLKGLVVLELDANWTPKYKPTDDNIKKTFKEFNAE